MGICCMAQETHTGALYQPRGVGWGERGAAKSLQSCPTLCDGQRSLASYGPWFPEELDMTHVDMSTHTDTQALQSDRTEFEPRLSR